MVRFHNKVVIFSHTHTPPQKKNPFHEIYCVQQNRFQIEMKKSHLALSWMILLYSLRLHNIKLEKNWSDHCLNLNNAAMETSNKEMQCILCTCSGLLCRRHSFKLILLSIFVFAHLCIYTLCTLIDDFEYNRVLSWGK